jgi:hypothetical protein
MLRSTTYLIPSLTRISVYYSYYPLPFDILGSTLGLHQEHKIGQTNWDSKYGHQVNFLARLYRSCKNTEALFRKYYILRFNRIVKYEGIMTIFKLDKRLMRSTLSSPLYSEVHGHFTYTHTNFYLPNPSTNYLKRSLFFTGLADFNGLPARVKM